MINQKKSLFFPRVRRGAFFSRLCRDIPRILEKSCAIIVQELKFELRDDHLATVESTIFYGVSKDPT